MNTHYRPLLLLAAGLLATALSPSVARAAQSYDNCTGFIKTLPATISLQGTWCLSEDVSTAIATGAAITVATNNVTLDCNDFKIGGLAAGPATKAVGVLAQEKLNVTVRRCNIRGFLYGVRLRNGTGGNVVEDNSFSGNTARAISVEGDGTVVRRNLVRDTGGSTASSWQGSAAGIATYGDVDVIDNIVSQVAALPNESGNASATGIHALLATSGSISHNRVRGLVSVGMGMARGIDVIGEDPQVILRGNDITGPGTYGLQCTGARSRAMDNIVVGFSTPLADCRDDGNSL